MTKKTTYTRHPAILTLNGQSQHVDRIEHMSFIRRPCSRDDYLRPGMDVTAFITKTVDISEEDFDKLLYEDDRSPLLAYEGEGGHLAEGPIAAGLLCIEMKSPVGTLLVDPEQGGPYWYIAELP